MNPILEAGFHDEMLSTYYKAGREKDYWANRFFQKVGQTRSTESCLKTGLQEWTNERCSVCS